jgi:hypothetical protein
VSVLRAAALSVAWWHQLMFTIVGTKAIFFPASFCCREKARISSLEVKTGMVTSAEVILAKLDDA